MSFSSGVFSWVNKTKKNMERIKKEASLDLFTSIVISTPVDQGYLINNWFAGNGKLPTNLLNETDTSGDKSKKRIEATINENKIGESLFLVNNTAYAIPIEYNGHSAKAKNGMVRVNVARWDQIVARVKVKYGV